MTTPSGRTVEIEIADRRRLVSVDREGPCYAVRIDGSLRRVDAAQLDAGTYSLIFPDENGRTARVSIRRDDAMGDVLIELAGVTFRARLANVGRRGPDEAARLHNRSAQTGGARIVAPMPGKIVRILVAPGDAVRARQAVAVMEAMKMENEIRATGDGVVREIPVTEGTSIEAGTVICVIG